MHLAQLNIAKPLAALDSPQLAEFVDNLDTINALAENSPGFVWRLMDADNDATAFRFSSASDAIVFDAIVFDAIVFDATVNDAIVNMSVWLTAEHLKTFVYDTVHVQFLQRKSDWFHKLANAHQVMWWVPEGHRPTLAEAEQRLQRLHIDGESPEAFTFRWLGRQQKSGRAT
ncbi:DUF3291 domain-containing protein [Reinekea sp.]|jgi:hypothetical protein|uniref:DUF3291 domain-containing protein n=1 Tax=Reinekea sp. TaxID=1970455 RepID=UPI002A7EAD6B|nr:DUF3291 domain-containing protein [Reinekea sp.]